MTSALKVPALPTSLTSTAEQKMRRLSKSGKRSFGSSFGTADGNGGSRSKLSTDDFAELARVEQKRALAASSRSKPKADPALLSMFASTMKLAQTGKITHKNAFQLQLIDHMADIIQQPDETEATTAGQTPQKASKKHTSATGTPPSTASFTTPSARSSAPAQSDASPSSTSLTPATRQPATLSDITNQQKRHTGKPQVNFVKASSTLDASVMIYSGRVDNVHKDAYRMAGGLTAQRMEREEAEEEAAAADEDEAGSAAEKANRAQRKRRAATTIESKVSNLNMKQVERREDGDPFFKRMSAAFDAGGAKGMLTHQLSVYRGAEVALDGQLLVMDETRDRAVEGLTQHVDMTELSELLHNTASNWRQLTVCPLMREMETIRNELEGKPTQTEEEDITSLESSMAAAQLHDIGHTAEDSDNESTDGLAGMEVIDGGTGSGTGMDLNVLHAEIDAAIAQEQRLDSHMAQPIDDEYDDDTAATTTDSVSPALSSDAATFSFLAPGLFGAPTDGSTVSNSSQSQLASMAHWKFKATSTNSTLSTQRQPRQTKATAPINFYAPVPASAFAIVPKKRLTTLRLSVATLRKRMEPTARAALMRPTAATYNVANLMRLYGRDNSVSIRANHEERIEERKQAEDESAAAGGNTYAWDDMGGDDDNDSAPAFDSTDATHTLAAGSSDVQSDFTLLAKPKQVEQVSIGYAQTAKRVDVKKLKECLWSGISTATHSNDEHTKPIEDEWDEEQSNQAPIAPITFQHAIDTLAGRYPANQLASISVPYCFICVLHLCNEEGLVLESDPFPSSSTGTTGSDDTKDRRTNLSSFTIKAAQQTQ